MTTNETNEHGPTTPIPAPPRTRTAATNRPAEIIYEADGPEPAGRATRAPAEAGRHTAPRETYDAEPTGRQDGPWLTPKRKQVLADCLAATFVALTLALALAVAMAP